ncbi:hypothetical protein Droror1_Dr00020115 [Drosera rotundifolia]
MADVRSTTRPRIRVSSIWGSCSSKVRGVEEEELVFEVSVEAPDMDKKEKEFRWSCVAFELRCGYGGVLRLAEVLLRGV